MTDTSSQDQDKYKKLELREHPKNEEGRAGEYIPGTVGWLSGESDSVNDVLVIWGTTGNDAILPQLPDGSVAHKAWDAIYGGDGDDIIWGLGGHDIIQGESGNDTLIGNTGQDQLLGGEGHDMLFGDNHPGRILEWSGENPAPALADIASWESDRLSGDAGDDSLFGGIGDDYLDGGAGYDHLYGGEDDDDLYGGTGEDFLVGGTGRDDLYGGDGKDTFYFETGDGTDFIYDFEYGSDKIYLLIDRAAGVTPDVKLTKIDSSEAKSVYQVEYTAVDDDKFDQYDRLEIHTDAVNLTLDDLDIVVHHEAEDFAPSSGNQMQRMDGTEWRDIMIGTRRSEEIHGGAKNDFIDGGGGGDDLYGGTGDDVFVYGRNYGSVNIKDFEKGDKISLFLYGITRDDLKISDGPQSTAIEIILSNQDRIQVHFHEDADAVDAATMQNNIDDYFLIG